MADNELGALLEALERDTLMGDNGGREAARGLREAAVKGRDLEAVVPAVLDAALECNDITILGPLVEAVVMHCLRRDDARRLREMAGHEHFRMFVVDALRTIMGRGGDVTAALPMLLGSGGKRLLDDTDLRRLLSRYVKKQPSALDGIVQTLLAQRPSWRGLPDLISDLVMYEKVDVAPLMPALAKLLDHSETRFRCDLACMLRVAAEGGVDLTSAASILEPHLSDPSDDVRSRISYSLTYTHAARGRHDEASALLHHADATVRLGATWALSVLLNHPKDTAAGKGPASHLACALLAPDAAVRGAAAKGIEAARRKGIPTCADDPTLATLAREGTSPAVIEYLYACALDDARVATHLRTVVASRGVTRDLAAALEEIGRGVHAPPCDLCRELPRSGYWSYDSDVPAEAARLTGSGRYRRCPRCGQLYAWERTEEWDDMSLDISITLARVPPDEALTALRGEERDAFRATFATLLERYRRDLRSPLTRVRQEASWVLARDAVKRDDEAALLALLEPRDDAITGEVLRMLSADVPRIGHALEAVLSGLLAHADSSIRGLAAGLLACLRLHAGRTDEVCAMLDPSDPEVVVAVLGKLDTVDEAPFAARLRVLAAHRDDRVRRLAEGALSRLWGQAPTVSDLVRRLASRRAAVRKEAASALQDLAQDDHDISSAVPALVDMLGQREAGWSAMKALEAGARHRADVRAAAPALQKMLGRRGYRYKAELIDILSAASRQGADISAAYPAVASCLYSTQAKYGAVRVLQEAVARGDDVGAAEAALRDQLERGDSYMRETCASVLAPWLLRQQRWAEVAAMLGHKRYGVRYAAAGAIERTAEAGAARDDIVDGLLACLSHKVEVVRAAARRALDAMKPWRADVTARMKAGQGSPGRAASRVSGAPTSVSAFDAQPPSAVQAPQPTPPLPQIRQPTGLRTVEVVFDGRPVLVGLLMPLALDAPPRSLPDVYRAIERPRDDGVRLRMLGHRLADALLASETWRELEGYAPFLTDCVIAYEAPGQPLSSEISFAFEGCPTLRLATGPYEGETNVALVVTDLTSSDFVEHDGEVRLDVAEDRLVPLRQFPDSSGWYLVDPATAVPCGFEDRAALDARRLQRLDGAYIGPVGRGTRFSGFPIDDTRHVLAGNFALRDHYGVLVEALGDEVSPGLAPS